MLVIYITGDTHGDYSHIEEFCWCNETTKDDVIIILGDASINFHGDYLDVRLKSVLEELPITLFCIHGNHEMRPESIQTYEEVEKFCGIVYLEQAFPSLLFAKDGEIYDFEGRKCVVIGGAYSVDRAYRKEGVDWWADEQPSDWIKEYVEKRLEVAGWCVDVVLSHTCPLKYLPLEALLPIYDRSRVDNTTEEWLDTVEDRLSYSNWYCGHFHTEKIIEKIWFMFENIMEFD